MKKKSIKHWSPRYITNRLKDIIFQFFNPHLPWLTPDSIKLIKKIIKKKDTALELGSGRSTIWISGLVETLYSIETDKSWFNYVDLKIKKQNIKNINLILVRNNNKSNFRKSYMEELRLFNKTKFDIILIDGKFRDLSTIYCIKMLNPGGVLIIDNINRYLPSNSFSPNSRTYKMGPLNKNWESIGLTLKNWRSVWTTNGVTDTAIFFKP